MQVKHLDIENFMHLQLPVLQKIIHNFRKIWSNLIDIKCLDFSTKHVQMNNCSLIELNLNNLHHHVALNEIMSLKFGSSGALLQKKSSFLIIKTKN